MVRLVSNGWECAMSNNESEWMHGNIILNWSLWWMRASKREWI